MRAAPLSPVVRRSDCARCGRLTIIAYRLPTPLRPPIDTGAGDRGGASAKFGITPSDAVAGVPPHTHLNKTLLKGNATPLEVLGLPKGSKKEKVFTAVASTMAKPLWENKYRQRLEYCPHSDPVRSFFACFSLPFLSEPMISDTHADSPDRADCMSG